MSAEHGGHGGGSEMHVVVETILQPAEKASVVAFDIFSLFLFGILEAFAAPVAAASAKS